MSKIRDLPQISSLDNDDLLYAVDSSAGPNGGRKITKEDLKTSVAPTAAETKAAYESNLDTNAFTDAEKAKLAGVEAGATADQTAAEVPYNNSISGLSATQVQDAIDQVNTKSQADFKPSIVSGRILHYSGGTARFDDVFFQLVAGDILLTPNITNGEVYVDLDGLVKQTGSGITAPPLSVVFARFSTDLNNIISLIDLRVKNSQNLVRGILADIRDVRAGASSSAGTSGRLSDAMHKHNILTGAASGIDANSTNTEGTSVNLARADHTHDLATGAASSQTPDQSNAEGSSANFARADHVHNIPTAAPIQNNANGSNDQGVAATFAKSDHKHDILTAAPATQHPDQSNAAGASSALARADHIHNIPADAPITNLSPATANAEGTGTSFARNDHTHALDMAQAGDLSVIMAGDAEVLGSINRLVKADHQHAVSTAAPVTQAPDQSNAEGTSTSLARADHVHNIPAAGPSTDLSPATANAEGVSSSFARADHTHAVDTGLVADISTASPDDSAAAGVLDKFARADHKHAIATAAPTTTLSPATTNAKGTGTSFARNDHTHAIATGLVADISTIQPDDSAAAGVLDKFARADHKHAIVASPASTQTPDQSNAEGVATSFARADHIHNIPTAAATGLSAATTNTQGAASTFAKSDHTHAIATGAASSQTPDQANGAGTSSNLARADHVHNIPTAVPSDIGSANAQGSAASFVKSDHVHKGLHSIKANSGGTQRFGDVALLQGNGTTASDDGAGNITIDTSAGPSEFVITGTSGLQINYSGGRFLNVLNGTVAIVPPGSITVPANTTLGYLYIAINTLSSTPVVTASVTVPPLDSMPFATFVSSGSTITLTTDIRAFVKTVSLSNVMRVGYPGSGLIVSYNAGTVRINGTLFTIAAGNLTLANTIASGAIYVDPTTGLVTANTTGVFPPNCAPMALYTTSGGVVTVLNGARNFLGTYVVFGASGDIASLTPDLTAAAGSTNKYADAGHVHNVPTAAAIGLSASTTNTQGAASTFAKSDHTHAIASGAASGQTPDQANAAGTSASFAKADHVHNIPTAAASGLNSASTSTQGAAATFARSDHTHAIASGAASSQTPDQANAAGASANFAKADHVHNIPTAAATSISTSTANAQGAAATFARADHTHAVSVTSSEATATADDTTTSLTDVLMNSMTLTPAAGTYLAIWSGSIVNSANGAERTWVSLYSGGTQVSATERSVGTSGGAYDPSYTQAIITVNGSQAIELRWRAAGGTSTVHSRRLTLLRIA